MIVLLLKSATYDLNVPQNVYDSMLEMLNFSDFLMQRQNDNRVEENNI